MNLYVRMAAVAGLSIVITQGLVAAADAARTPSQSSDDDTSNTTHYAASFFAEFGPTTARDMIGRLPGFSFDGGASGRGFSGTAGNVLIDGQRPPSRGDTLSDILSRIPARAVERIDIVRAGAGGIDMQGQSIVANVIRKRDSGLSGAVAASVGISETGTVSPSARMEVQSLGGGLLLEGAITLDLSDANQSEMRLRTGPDGGILELGQARGDYAFQRMEAKGAFEAPLFGGNLRTNALASHRTESGDYIEGLLVQGGVREIGSDGSRTSGEAGLRYTREIAGYDLEVVGYQSVASAQANSGNVTPTYTSDGRNDLRSGETIARASVKIPTGDSLSLEAGAEAVFNWIDSEDSRTLDGQPFVLAGDENHVEEKRNEAFGAATWTPVKGLSIEAGARFEQSTIVAESTAGDSQKELRFLKPRVNVSWSPADGRQWGVRVERSVDQLSFSSFASTTSFETGAFGVGNSNIEPAKKWEYEARFEQQFGGQTSLVAKLVHSELEDILGRVYVTVPETDATPERSYEIMQNASNGSRDSLEIDGALELDNYGLSGGLISVGLTLRDSSLNDPVTVEQRRFSNDQRYSWNVGISQDIYAGRLKWSLYASDSAEARSWQPRSITVSDDGVNGGGSLTWKPDAVWTMSGSVSNIFASGEEDELTLHNTPRPTGSIRYIERSTSAGARLFRVGLRRNF